MKPEGIASKAVANWMIAHAMKGSRPVDHMKLHKLLYFAHGWHLALANKRPLLDEFIEAWDYGPVVPSVYQEFKKFGAGVIDELALSIVIRDNILESRFVTPTVQREVEDPIEASELEEFLEAVWDRYGKRTGIELSRMTHQPGTPWRQIRDQYGNRKNADIPDDLIYEWFAARVGKLSE